MSTGKYPPTFPPEDAAAWRRIRRYAVPHWMIEQATERRLAGDWRGACAAANVDVTFDLPTVLNEYGAEVTARLENDLRHFVPDLMRWHAPRFLHGRTTMRPDACIVLAGYGPRISAPPYLYAATHELVDGPQRLTLRFGSAGISFGRIDNWITMWHLWDSRLAVALRERCVSDPPRHDEWVRSLHDQGEVRQACEASGITLDETPPSTRYYSPPPLLSVLARYPLALTRLEPEIRRLAAIGFGERYQIRTPYSPLVAQLNTSAPGLTIQVSAWDNVGGVNALSDACWRRLPDLDLLRFGDITPDELHPMVSASLFPGRATRQTRRVPDVEPPSGVRVRCRGEWHVMRSADGALQMVSHSATDINRERALRAFGGPNSGCFAVREAWTSGTGWLPKALRDQRREFFLRVQHGDTPAVIQLLDTGVDPHIRDGKARTLLHVLHLLDHEALVPGLLAAGLDLEARDHRQRTPLYAAVEDGGSTDVVRMLLDSGARTDVADSQGVPLRRAARYNRYDMDSLLDMLK